MEKDHVRQWRSIQNAIMTLDGPRFQTPSIVKRRGQLIKIEQEVDGLSVKQGTKRHRDGHTLKRLRSELRKHHLNPISREGVLILEGEPGIKDQLRLPHLSVSDRKLIEDARRIIKTAKLFADSYIADGKPPDFIQKAERAVSEFEHRISTPTNEMVTRARATAAIPDVLLKGRQIMLAITGLVEDELAHDSVAQKLWKRAKRLPGTMGRPKDNFRGRRIDPPRNDDTIS